MDRKENDAYNNLYSRVFTRPFHGNQTVAYQW
jgi:hypothetical protein